MSNYATLLGRILLAHMFLISGIQKISGYAGTQQYMESVGLPGMLLPLVILLEIGGGLALILGWFTRWAAWALGAFTLLAGILFHWNFADQMQTIMFMKNICIVGGMLILAEHGAGAFSLDAKFGKK